MFPILLSAMQSSIYCLALSAFDQHNEKLKTLLLSTECTNSWNFVLFLLSTFGFDQYAIFENPQSNSIPLPACDWFLLQVSCSDVVGGFLFWKSGCATMSLLIDLVVSLLHKSSNLPFHVQVFRFELGSIQPHLQRIWKAPFGLFTQLQCMSRIFCVVSMLFLSQICLSFSLFPFGFLFF